MFNYLKILLHNDKLINLYTMNAKSIERSYKKSYWYIIQNYYIVENEH